MEYRSILGNINPYFSTTFKKYVYKNIVNDAYSSKCIEDFGYFNGVYKKLSDELIDSFQRYSCQSEEAKSNIKYNQVINKLISDNKLQYSKKEEGRNMLSRLVPDNVVKECGNYFAKAYNELKGFFI